MDWQEEAEGPVACEARPWGRPAARPPARREVTMMTRPACRERRQLPALDLSGPGPPECKQKVRSRTELPRVPRRALTLMTGGVAAAQQVGTVCLASLACV